MRPESLVHPLSPQLRWRKQNWITNCPHLEKGTDFWGSVRFCWPLASVTQAGQMHFLSLAPPFFHAVCLGHPHPAAWEPQGVQGLSALFALQVCVHQPSCFRSRHLGPRPGGRVTGEGRGRSKDAPYSALRSQKGSGQITASIFSFVFLLWICFTFMNLFYTLTYICEVMCTGCSLPLSNNTKNKHIDAKK